MSDKELNLVIDRAEDEYQKLKDKVIEQGLEIERLNNIINELEKWLEDDNILIFDFTGSINKSEGTLISDEEISKKIEELKGDSSND